MTNPMTFSGSLGHHPRRLKDISYKERILSKIEKKHGCWIFKSSLDELGYGRISFNGRCRLVTRVMWELTYGKIPNKMLVCHKCDNPPCVNPKHLFLGTNKDNVHDMINKKRKVILCGDRHPRSKIGRKDVINIRNSQLSAAQLAKKFDLSTNQIWRIRSHRLWKNLGEVHYGK